MGDLFAGLTLWAVFAAQALAYSRLAHATPIAGLTTAMVGALIYAALGSSRRISIGPAGGVCAIVGATVMSGSSDQLPARIAALTMLTGVMLALAGAMRISFLRRLFPMPVFVGYLAGTGASILVGQARELIASPPVARIIGLGAIAAVLLLKRVAPKLPAPFVVLSAALALNSTLGLDVPIIGDELGHFGSFVDPLSIPRALYVELLIPAAALALFVYVDGLANAEALASPSDPPLHAQREYWSFGAVNALCGLTGGFVAGCSTSRSLVAIRAGAQSRLAPVVAGALLLLTALSVVHLLRPMPLAALAGVVLVAAFDLIDRARLREFWRLRRVDFLIACAAAGGVLLLGPMRGVGLGVLAALGEALHRAMQPHRSVVAPRGGEHYYEAFRPAQVPVIDGMTMYRFGAPLFFANCDLFLGDMRELVRLAPADLRTVIINADTLGVPDASAREALHHAQDALRTRDIQLVFGNAREPVRNALRAVGAFTLLDEPAFIAALKTVRGGAPATTN